MVSGLKVSEGDSEDLDAEFTTAAGIGRDEDDYVLLSAQHSRPTSVQGKGLTSRKKLFRLAYLASQHLPLFLSVPNVLASQLHRYWLGAVTPTTGLLSLQLRPKRVATRRGCQTIDYGESSHLQTLQWKEEADNLAPGAREDWTFTGYSGPVPPKEERIYGAQRTK